VYFEREIIDTLIVEELKKLCCYARSREMGRVFVYFTVHEEFKNIIHLLVVLPTFVTWGTCYYYNCHLITISKYYILRQEVIVTYYKK